MRIKLLPWVSFVIICIILYSIDGSDDGYLSALAMTIAMSIPALKKIFCVFGWHTWEYQKGAHRECIHCKKRQSKIKVGNDEGWS